MISDYTDNNNIALVGYQVKIYDDDDDEHCYDKREILTEEGQKFAEENNILFFEISDNEEFKINECFNTLINKIYDNEPNKSNYKCQNEFRLNPINKFLNM